MPDLLTTLLVAAPAALAVLGLASGRSARFLSALTSFGSMASVACAIWLARGSVRGEVVVAQWSSELLVSLSWRVETVSLALAILIASIGALVLQNAGAYFSASGRSRATIVWLAVFESSMLGLVMADNLYLLFVFWELTGIASFFLIGSDGSDKAFAAARRALLVTSAGALPMLVGFVYLTSVTGTASLSTLLQLELGGGIQNVALALLLPAVITKSAQVPLHSWLPGAMAAPTPVSAYLHSATMVKAGIILLLYVYPLLGGGSLWTPVLVPIGAITCIWGSYRALGEPDIKLLLAWSTVSQLGLLTLTIGLGTDLAVRAAVLHLFAHAIFKAGLFLSVGGIDKVAGTRSLFELGGLGRKTPVLFLVTALLAGSMAGIPPLAGFLSKELILKKAMLTELWVHVVAIGGLVLGSIGTVAYSSRLVMEVFLGRPRSERVAKSGRLEPALVAAPALLAAVTVAAGPGAAWVDRWFLEPVTASVVGRFLPEVTPLSLWYGINAAFVLSVAIVSIGYLSDRIARLKMLPGGIAKFSGEQLFDSAMSVSQRVGAVVSRLLSGRHPSIYLGIALAAGFVAAVPVLFDQSIGTVPAPRPAGVITVLFLMAILGAVLVIRNRLARVLLVSAAGFAVAFIYRLLNAPDLMLTQLLVEVLVTIFFALSLRGLPRREPTAASGRSRWLRRLLAAGSGLVAGSLVLAFDRTEPSGYVQEFYRDAAPELAKGLNVVNVILTDFRALDTMMETLVVLLAAFGVAGLVLGRERSRRQGDQGVSAARAANGLLPGMSRLILPLAAILALALFIKGHNEPGGGFVAGLSFGIATILAMSVAARAGARGRSGTAALVGATALLVSFLASLAFGLPALTHAHGELEVAGLSWKWHTALFFDLGVVLAVAGGVALATSALWPSGRSEDREVGS